MVRKTGQSTADSYHTQDAQLRVPDAPEEAIAYAIPRLSAAVLFIQDNFAATFDDKRKSYFFHIEEATRGLLDWICELFASMEGYTSEKDIGTIAGSLRPLTANLIGFSSLMVFPNEGDLADPVISAIHEINNSTTIVQDSILIRSDEPGYIWSVGKAIFQTNRYDIAVIRNILNFTRVSYYNWKGNNLRKPDEEFLRREPKGDLKDEELRARIQAKVGELSGQSLAQLWAFLSTPKPASEPKPIPTEPPDGLLYENRPSKSENAPAFIQRVYGPWLDGNFTRADLRRIDPKAITGLKNWERENKQRAEINLPTIKEKNDALLAAGSLASSDPTAVARLAAAAVYRKKKNP